MTTPLATYMDSLTENEFQNAIITLAEDTGWLWYHTYDSRRSPAGFPDLVLVRDGYLILAELKTQRGEMTEEQEEWAHELRLVQKGLNIFVDDVAFSRPRRVRYFVWRPSDWDDIAAILTAERGSDR